MSDPFAQFKATYINECFELLADMEEKLMGLDESADKETLNAIFRCAHSIKGGAGAFGYTNIASFTHVLEALLDNMRESKILPTPAAVDCLLRSRDVVFQMITAAQNNSTLADNFGDDLIEELKAFSPGIAGAAAPKKEQATTAKASGAQTYSISFLPKASLISNGNEPLLLLRELAGLGNATITSDISRIPALESLQLDGCYISWNITLETEKPEPAIREVFEFVEDECDLTISVAASAAAEEVSAPAPKPSATPAASSAAAPAATPQTTSIRVDIDKVDRLINMVGEVVITQAYLASQTRDLPTADFGDLIRSVDDMMHHIRELQESVMAIRMQPVKSIFSRMPRLVRDLANQLEKEIHLEMSGENTEVDKTIIEQLADPLTHMIRNSVDHGIEMPGKRAANGKPRLGTIHLSAEHRGGKIVIQIADDGGGINREKVFSKAKEKGVIAPDATLSDEEIDMLIFAPGFSTADVVSNVSGRGVGMDVVRRNIEGLGGVVQVTNRPGVGSTFAISLPLTLAILDGMIVRCGAEYYVVPINSIIETLRPKAEEVRPLASGGSVINVRGAFIPVLYLHEVFRIQNSEPDASKALVVLVENGSNVIGLVVDELVGQQQVVIKSLEENTDPVQGVSGATILGDGKVSLILDVIQLSRMLNVMNQSMQEAA
jgi:two-component system, chemotaxis family, sensor kinase CheA